MASILGCFRPRRHRPARPSVAGLGSVIAAKRHSAIAFITGLHCDSTTATETSNNDDHEIKDDANNAIFGLGVLIYPSLLLTTHNTVPSIASVQNAEIVLRYSETSLNILRRKFLPDLFFVTDPELNLTVIACEFVSPEMHPMGLDTAKYDIKALDVGNKAYIMGYNKKGTAAGEPTCKLSVGSGYIITNHNHKHNLGSLIEIRTRDEAWMEGSAGFDQQGIFAFLVTGSPDLRDTSKALKSKGVSVPAIRQWLEPQWKATKAEIGNATKTNLYTRRATYAGPDTVIDSCVREFDTNHHDISANQSLSEAHDDDIKASLIRIVDVAAGKASITQNVNKKPINVSKKKTAIIHVADANPNLKANPNPSPNTNPNLDKAGRGGFEAKVTVKEDKKVGGGFNEGKPTDHRRSKPTLQQAFQRDRRSLQLRLTDLRKH